MREIAVVDCETDPFKLGRVPKPFIWGYYNGKQYHQFKSTKKFIQFLQEQAVIVYAHNGGKFDWHFLLEHLNPYDEVMIINGRIAKCFIGMAECRDSYNILPIPLAAYKKDEIDYKIMEESERNKPHNWKKITEYLKSDCVYLYELVTSFIDTYGLQITQASAAMSQWKKISQKPTPRTDRDFYEKFSPYYYGGRVECFQTGIIERKFHVYDINSAYPFAMQNQHPYSSEFVEIDGFIDDADFYDIECVSKGAFPFRGLGMPNANSGLRFPSDKNEVRYYTVTKWEYRAAIKTKSISKVKVVKSIAFLGHTDFKDYINYFWNKRLEAQRAGNEAQRLFAKLLMNSLYGKFAANPANYKQHIIVPMDVIAGLDSQGWQFAGEFGPWGLAEADLSEEMQRYYNVATGASITGFVRAMLWEAICDSDDVLYCDTDSIAVGNAGPTVLLGDELGLWKHEGEFDKAGIAGKKLYIFRGVPNEKGKREYKTASKGARLTNDQLWSVAKGEKVNFEYEVPTFSIHKSPRFVNREIKFTAKAEK